MSMKYQKLKQNVTIEDFTPLIPWSQIEYILGKRRYARFAKWMQGQTTIEGGVYIDDLDRFLKNLPVID